MIQSLIRNLLLIVLTSQMTACAVNPVTGESQLLLVSTADEIALGEKQYALSIQQQGGSYHADSAVNTYVAEVGQRLAALSHQPDLPYEFSVINSSVPNAWALPGGKIAINRGLLTMLDDEAQLAAVLGHEIVHVTARHGAQGMSNNILLQAGATIAGIAAGEMGDLAASGVMAGGGMIVAKYGRNQELEADFYGTEYISQAGYNPIASAELQAKLMALSMKGEQDFLSTLFASHPPSKERMDRNKELADTLSGNKRNKKRFQQKLATLIHDIPAYQYFDEANKLRHEKKFGAALKLINKAIKLEAKEGSFWELKGDLLFEQDKLEAAMPAYNTAVKVNPDFFQHYLARGIGFYEQQQYKKANADFKAANKRLATRIGIFYLGEVAMSQGFDQQAYDYFKQLANSSDVWGNKARDRMLMLEGRHH
jgi:predicted Zn-dependent protease